MKIAYLAARSSVHVTKIANAMIQQGHEVHIITMHDGSAKLDDQIMVHQLPLKAPHGYYLNIFRLKKVLKAIDPDILHTHYGSGYGTLLRLTGFSPNVLSVWGSDVFVYPYKSKRNMRIIQKNLAFADQIASTSKAMIREVNNLTSNDKEIELTPFGIDLSIFLKNNNRISENKEKVTIGTVKSMEDIYGIDILIKSFALLKRELSSNIELVLVGGGSRLQEYRNLVDTLQIGECVKFIGQVHHEDVPYWLNTFDIYCALSRSESFGVAVLEASACELPVIVSDVGGLPEVVIDNITGYVVQLNNIENTAEKMKILVGDNELRKRMGKAGRNFVSEHYNWSKNIELFVQIYTKLVSGDYN